MGLRIPGSGALKDYYFHWSTGRKREAESEAKRLRKQGYVVRIEKVRAYMRGRQWNYVLWIKPERTFRRK